jgi:hypothetical protein
MSAESQYCEASRELLLGNGSVNRPVARLWLYSRHVMAATETHQEEQKYYNSSVSEIKTVWKYPGGFLRLCDLCTRFVELTALITFTRKRDRKAERGEVKR